LIAAIESVAAAMRVMGKALRTALEYAIPATIAFGSAWTAINFRLIVSTVGMLANTLIALAGSLSLATLKQYAFNAAQSANVMGMIIVAAGLTAAALNMYSDNLAEATEASDKASEANLDYQAALAIRKRRTEEASFADVTAGLTADQLRAKIVELTRTEQILNAERLKAGTDLVGINVIETALEKNRAALAATTAALAKVTITAGEAEKKRLDNLVALTGLTEVTRAEFGQLLAMESGYAAALASGNLSVAARVELLQKQKAALDALAASTMQGEAARMSAIGGQRAQSAGLERRPVDTSGVTELPAIESKGVTLPPVLVSPATELALALARTQASEAESVLERMKALGTATDDEVRKLEGRAVAARQTADRLATQSQTGAPSIALPTVDTSLAESIRKQAEGARSAIALEADNIANDLRGTFAESISSGIIDGISAGFERAFATGKIGEGFKALGGTMLAGLGSAMIQFGKAGLSAALLMDGFLKSLSNMLPGGAVAKAVAMIALGGTLRGVASAAFGGGGGGGGMAVTPTTQFGIPMQSDGSVTRLLFGQTSATTAAGMQPRTATNVTIIGPDDPKAQRAIEELITKGQRRGTLG
jgi:hypothetical protein